MRMQIADKYVLGELEPAEREEFEQHFFECSDCAEDVRLGFQFRENAKSVFAQESLALERAPSPRRDWFAWMRPMAWAPLAAGLLVAFIGYQNTIQIPALQARVQRLQRPQALPAMILAPSSRSSVPSIGISPATDFFQLSLAIGPVAPAQQYRLDLRSDAGKSLATVPVAQFDPDANLTLLIPTTGLSAGSYEAVLSGVTGGIVKEIDHYRFAVHRE